MHMTQKLTDEAVGKTVVDTAGKELGIVAKVEDGRAYVDPNPSVAEHLLAMLGIEGEDDEDYVVTADMLKGGSERLVLQGEL